MTSLGPIRHAGSAEIAAAGDRLCPSPRPNPRPYSLRRTALLRKCLLYRPPDTGLVLQGSRCPGGWMELLRRTISVSVRGWKSRHGPCPSLGQSIT